jgi:lipopolysaccharide export system permease protein
VSLKIIERSFYREAATATIAMIVVLSSLFLMQGAGVLLAQTAEDAPKRNVLLVMLVLNTLKDYGVLMLLSVYIGVLFTLTRWYRDSEMAVLSACGIGTTRLLRPVLIFALVCSLAVAAQTFWLRPIVFQAIDGVSRHVAERQDIGWISQGAFNSSRRGGPVVYVEQTDGNVLHNIFVEESGTPGRVIVAASGRQFTDVATGEETLQLKQGISYEGTAGSGEYRTVEFDSYRLRITPATRAAPKKDNLEAIGTGKLWRSGIGTAAARQAELQGRISKPVMVFVLAAIALALSFTEPRRGRFFNLFVSVVFFFLYMNLTGIGKTLIRDGRIPPAVGLWWIHLLFIAVASWFLWRRHLGKPLLSISLPWGRP